MPRSRQRKKPSRRPSHPISIGSKGDEHRSNIGNALVRLIEPYVPPEPTSDELEKLLTLATVAWNVSQLPPAERDWHIRTLAREAFPPPRFRVVRLLMRSVTPKWLRSVAGSDRVDDLVSDLAFERVVHEMVDRKERLFPSS